MAGLCLYLWAYFPGYMSHDAAFQYWQLRHQDYHSMSPLAMTLLWQGLNHWIPGPGGLFVVQLLLFWAGLWMLIHQLTRWSASKQALILLLCGLLPFNLLTLPHLWKDVLVLDALIWASALFIRAGSRPSGQTIWRLVASLCAASSVLFRIDAAIPAFILISLFWMLALRRRPHGSVPSVVRAAVSAIPLALLCLLLMLGVRTGLELATGAQRAPLFPSVALWDLARVSVAEEKDLVPAFTHSNPQVNLETLARHVPPWSNVPVLTHQLRSGLWLGYTDQQRGQIRQAWISMLAHHSGAYLSHRLTVFGELLRWQDHPDKPDTVYQVRAMTPLRDNPPHALNRTDLHRSMNRAIDALLETPLLKPWLYLMITLFGLSLSLGPMRKAAGAAPATILLASGLLHALSMMVLAPSAEVRYLLWMVNASVLGLCVLLAHREPQTVRSEPIDAV